MEDNDAAQYEARVMAMELEAMREKESVFGKDSMMEENKRLRERVAEMSVEAATLRRTAAESQNESKSDVGRFQVLLERMYRESLKNVRERIYDDILSGMNDSTKDLMCQQDQLKEEVATLRRHSSAIDERCQKLESQKQQFKLEADIMKKTVEDQASEIVRLKKDLQQAFKESGELRDLLSNGTNLPGDGEIGAGVTQCDSENTVELQENLKLHQEKLRAAYDQRDRWREKCCTYSQTCARLQAELQMAVDHLTIDPASYSLAEQDTATVWQNQSKHVTFTEDTKNYSGKLEANPWAQTGKFFMGRNATGRPSIVENYGDEDEDGDPDLDALEDALMNSGSTHDPFLMQEEDPLAAFRPSQTAQVGQLAPAVSGVPPIDFFVMVGDCELDEKPDTPPGTPDFFKMEAAANQAPEELKEDLESAVQNMWLVEDNGLVPEADKSSSEDSECSDEAEEKEGKEEGSGDAAASERGDGSQEVSKGIRLGVKQQDVIVDLDNPWTTASCEGESEVGDDHLARSASYAQELFGPRTACATEQQSVENNKDHVSIVEVNGKPVVRPSSAPEVSRSKEKNEMRGQRRKRSVKVAARGLAPGARGLEPDGGLFQKPRRGRRT